jgi:phosphocarrier protein HPr
MSGKHDGDSLAMTPVQLLIAASRRSAVGGSTTMKQSVLRRTIVIRNPDGLHIRPAAALAEAAKRFQAQVALLAGERRVDGRRVLDVITLAAEPGMEIILEVDGPDAEEAIEVLAEILASATPPLPDEPPLPPKG